MEQLIGFLIVAVFFIFLKVNGLKQSRRVDALNKKEDLWVQSVRYMEAKKKYERTFGEHFPPMKEEV